MRANVQAIAPTNPKATMMAATAIIVGIDMNQGSSGSLGCEEPSLVQTLRIPKGIRGESRVPHTKFVARRHRTMFDPDHFF